MDITFGSSTTDWKPCKGLGSFFRLLNGHLMVTPMMADGSMDSLENELDVLNEDSRTVDYPKEIEPQLHLIGRVLTGESFEGEKGDVLPFHCDKCMVRFGDDCQCEP